MYYCLFLQSVVTHPICLLFCIFVLRFANGTFLYFIYILKLKTKTVTTNTSFPQATAAMLSFPVQIGFYKVVLPLLHDSLLLISFVTYCIIASASTLLKLIWQILSIKSLLQNSIDKFQPLCYWKHEFVLKCFSFFLIPVNFFYFIPTFLVLSDLL